MRLVFHLLIFLLPLALLSFCAEKKLFSIPNSYNRKRADLEKGASEIQVLVLGSSQAMYGIDPALFSVPGYNLANSSQSLYYDRQLMLKEIGKLTGLRQVIIPVSYFSLYYRLEDSDEAWRAYYYYQFWNIPQPGMSFFDLRRYSLMALYTPTVSASLLINRSAGNFADGITERGFYGRDSAGSAGRISEESGRTRVALHDLFIEKGNYNQVSYCLSELVRLLHEKGIQPVIVTPPVFSTYSAFVSPAIMARNGQFIDSICMKSGAIYHNYFTDHRFAKTDFYDNDHLNSIGAQKFSRILNEEIVTKRY